MHKQRKAAQKAAKQMAIDATAAARSSLASHIARSAEHAPLAALASGAHQASSHSCISIHRCTGTGAHRQCHSMPLLLQSCFAITPSLLRCFVQALQQLAVADAAGLTRNAFL